MPKHILFGHMDPERSVLVVSARKDSAKERSVSRDPLEEPGRGGPTPLNLGSLISVCSFFLVEELGLGWSHPSP